MTEIRHAVQLARPGTPVGAFLLPFSAGGYRENTQAGQDLDRLAGAGLAEIVLMDYWDDWDHSPTWARERLDSAARLVAGRVPITAVLDGDMSVRTTRLTLEALGPWQNAVSWFLFDAWTEAELTRIGTALEGHRAGPMPRPDHVSVVIRIDTEPDDTPSYDTVHPQMIDTLLDLFAAEGVKATFLTVGRLAELQPDAVRRAAAAGHEIGSHSYDHEQIDSLTAAQQLVSVNRGLSSLEQLGFAVHGFGAPRNSITDLARDQLIRAGLEYDGSAAYDPLTSLIPVRYATRSDGGPGRIVVVPFVIPNDWDARVINELSAEEMSAAWQQRLVTHPDDGAFKLVCHLGGVLTVCDQVATGAIDFISQRERDRLASHGLLKVAIEADDALHRALPAGWKRPDFLTYRYLAGGNRAAVAPKVKVWPAVSYTHLTLPTNREV